MAQIVYYVCGRAWRWARPSAPCPSPCRPAISATSMPATPRGAWACRSSGWSSAPTATTSSRASSRPARMTIADGRADAQSRAWTSRSRATSSACCSTSTAATARRWPQAMASFRRSGQLAVGDERWQAARALFDALPLRRRRRRWPTIAGLHRQTGELIDPHSAVGIAAAQRGARDRRRADGGAGDRPSRQVPRRGRARHRRCGRRCRRAWPT